MTPHYRQSFIAALTGHFLLITTAVVVSVLPAFRRPKPVDLSALENIDITKIESFKKFERIKPPPEHPIPPPPTPPTTVPDPVTPPDPVPLPVVRPPDPKPTPKPPDTHPDGTIPDRTPPHDTKPKPAVSNLAATASVPVVRSTVRTTKVLSSVTGPRNHVVRPLTTGELDPMAGIVAPLGASNSVPIGEREQCLLRIKHALYDAWDQPALADAGSQPAELEIRFDAVGRVVGSSIVRSSGSEAVDRSVLQAARTLSRVDGLTPGFLKEFPSVTVDCKVTE